MKWSYNPTYIITGGEHPPCATVQASFFVADATTKQVSAEFHPPHVARCPNNAQPKKQQKCENAASGEPLNHHHDIFQIPTPTMYDVMPYIYQCYPIFTAPFTMHSVFLVEFHLRKKGENNAPPSGDESLDNHLLDLQKGAMFVSSQRSHGIPKG